ncbi:glycosyltransferase [Alteromonas antoniana]|uniref:glycosyltransferase n=1 Tax=Alteromonas antoniana TaxID=2803813 RepID=UPI001C43F3B3|nr:glycosyltransferase [Alteromonas antoniana]
MDISIIIPCYNALGKLERCLASLKCQTIDESRFEVIFIDDFSSDGSYEYLKEQSRKHSNWSVYQLKENSGSPSKPRNIGIEAAKGSYVFFLDCDDEILPDTLEMHFAFARDTDACIVRGFLLTDDGHTQKPMNQLPSWSDSLTKKDRIELIISKQSTTVSSLIKRELVVSERIRWPEDIRVGEDSLFLIEVLSKSDRIEYIPHPTFVYNKRKTFTLSSTQEYGGRELNNHINVWKRLIDAMQLVDLDYVELRLRVGLQTAIRGLIFDRSSDISASDFERFADFINFHKNSISKHSFDKRVTEVLESLYQEDYSKFTEACKPKLLIAGHDLKFIMAVVPLLKQSYQIKIDEWSGHDTHNEKTSKECLEWADYIWCEWLLGNAVWYSDRKLPGQKLIIRMHRFELGRSFGENINIENVDAVVCVSLLFFERLLERFPSIPRTKVKLIHNFVETEGYQQTESDERFFNLALIGSVPARKGLYRALQLLQKLITKNPKYKLKVFGTKYSDIPWLQKHRDEMDYFEECMSFIQENELTDNVEFLGHKEIKSALAEEKIGFVLSLSDDTPGYPGPESFHLAIADGFAAGARSLILKWSGSEYIYHDHDIFNSLEDIQLTIQESANSYNNESSVASGKVLMESYSTAQFLKEFKNAFSEL